MYTHILIPTDGSKLSEYAVKSAVWLAKTLNAHVTGFHAMPSTFMPYEGDDSAALDPDAMNEFVAAATARANDSLAVVEREAKTVGVPYKTLLATSNTPHEAVIAAAKNEGCDLIAMASHGRKGLEGILMGSETVKVLTHSTIPVLVYRQAA